MQTLTDNLEHRLQELRRAIESKELERQELLLKQTDLEAGLQAASGVAQAKSALELKSQVCLTFKARQHTLEPAPNVFQTVSIWKVFCNIFVSVRHGQVNHESCFLLMNLSIVLGNMSICHLELINSSACTAKS